MHWCMHQRSREREPSTNYQSGVQTCRNIIGINATVGERNERRERERKFVGCSFESILSTLPMSFEGKVKILKNEMVL